MDHCVRQFKEATCCTISSALQAASLHPANVLQLTDRGRLTEGGRGDIVIMDREMIVQATFISGEPVWTLPGSNMHREEIRYKAQ